MLREREADLRRRRGQHAPAGDLGGRVDDGEVGRISKSNPEAPGLDGVGNRSEPDGLRRGEAPQRLAAGLRERRPVHGGATVIPGERGEQRLFLEQVPVEQNRSQAEGHHAGPLEAESAHDRLIGEHPLGDQELSDERLCHGSNC